MAQIPGTNVISVPGEPVSTSQCSRGAHCSMKISNCKIIDLPKITEPRGNLTFIESNRHVPFEIARVYYRFDVVLDDGRDKARFHLNRSFYGLYIPRMIS